MNTDKALEGALRITTPLPRYVFSYDIACQYSVKLLARAKERFPEFAHNVELIKWLIPKLHSLGHQIKCQTLLSFNYTEGVGETDGEEIERLWSEMNQASGSTKQMNNGHRHDTLDAMILYLSWLKIQKSGTVTICTTLQLLTY